MTTAVVCAGFDAASDERIEHLRRRFERDGLRVRRAHRPHLSLAAARVVDASAVAAAVAGVARCSLAIHLTATGLGSFAAGVLFVAIAPNEALRALQRDVHATLAATWPPAFGRSSEPDHWIAHCTLATRVPPHRMGRLSATALEPFPISVDALAVLEVGGRGDVALLPLGA